MNSTAGSGLSADTQALMAFESNKKSVGVAYLLWFFTGGLGGHRFYLGRTGSAVAQLALTVFGWIGLLAAGAGLILLIPLGIWLLVDAFTIPGMVSAQNGSLMSRLNSSSQPAKIDPADELAKYAALKESGALTVEEYEEQKARIMGKPSPTAIASAPPISEPG